MATMLTMPEIRAVALRFACVTKSERELSWVYCHNSFLRAHRKKVYCKRQLSLHLMGYLASFGMYCRRAPLFLYHHYLVHEDLIPILMHKKHAPLFDVRSPTDFTSNMQLMCDVYDEIQEYYKGKGFEPSIILITKIMLGVYGCVPAIDSEVTRGMKKLMYPVGTSFSHVLQQIQALLAANISLDAFINSVLSTHSDYTYMRVLDDFLWHY